MQMSDNPTVVARDLQKTYTLTRSGSVRGFSRQSQRKRIRAVKSATFVARQGESIGILGKNGSGKSTLLRMIAGSESPTAGTVLVSAKPTLLGVSAALQGTLSGRENVRLGLLAMGLMPNQVAEMEQPVIEWSELGESIDRPLRTYSSGMTARLKFSIATSVKAEILLVDEALSTGDATFNAKAHERMESFLDSSGTVFLVSHGATTIQENCTRAIWLHEGNIIADGDAETITKRYRVWGNRQATGKNDEARRILLETRQTYDAPEIVFSSEIR